MPTAAPMSSIPVSVKPRSPNSRTAASTISSVRACRALVGVAVVVAGTALPGMANLVNGSLRLAATRCPGPSARATATGGPMGIVAFGTYLPLHRLDRSRIAAALGTPPGRGTRTVAAADEDTTTLGVEAARHALAALPDDAVPARLVFATAEPAYLDKTNATTIHAALGLPPSVPAYDAGGAVRSALGALRLADDAREPTLVVMAGVRTGLPGGADERDGGDGASAFVVGDVAGARTRTLGWGASSLEFLERWRLPGATYARQWAERFGA